MTAPARRLAALDWIRGIAILGILAVNVQGFAGPMAATVTPNWQGAAAVPDRLVFALTLVLFEGKMRALLSLAFGASLVLLVERADEDGRNGELLQTRRLLWLAVIGYLHFLLLWWGDILFTYALAGMVVLPLRRVPAKGLVAGALLTFAAWHGAVIAGSIPSLLAELRYTADASSPAETVRIEADRHAARTESSDELRVERSSWPSLAAYKLSEEPLMPLIAAFYTLGETVPLMMLGMALQGSGFFSGGWSEARLRLTAWAGIGFGGLATLALVALAWVQGFPEMLMHALLGGWLGVPHLAMGLGYAAALVLVAQRPFEGIVRHRVRAMGRMALSNYLGCTMVFTGLFYGWGGGLIGRVPDRWYPLLVLGGWAAMLLASRWWLARYRQGPLEWAWRSLVEWRLLPLRR